MTHPGAKHFGNSSMGALTGASQRTALDHARHRLAAVMLLAGLLLTGLLALSLWGAGQVLADDLEDEYRKAARSFHTLNKSTGVSAVQWRRLGERFYRIHQQAPITRRGADALYSAALSMRAAWKMDREWAHLSRAMEEFRRFVNLYPRDSLADDSLMHISSLQAEGYHDPEAALASLERITREYPQGDQLPLARRRIEETREEIRNEELQAKARTQEMPEERAQETAAAPVPRTVAMGAMNTGKAPSAGKTRGVPRLKRVQTWSTLEWTRVILSTDPGVPFKLGRLKKNGSLPERLYLDLAGAVPDRSVYAVTETGDHLLQRIRVNNNPAGFTRVVLDLNGLEKFEVKDFQLPAEQKIVVDIHPTPGQALLAKVAPAVQSQEPPHDPDLEKAEGTEGHKISLRNTLGLKIKRVMIDAGHGGEDPGAVAFGKYEKDLTLAIAKNLKKVVEKKHPGIKVGMTREKDVYVSLNDRTEMAKEFKADLLISIHLNANEIERFSGVETYFLNLTSDQGALEVAARENATTEKS
ncbi:MAG: N-acetylmuramoyl-L-alanine amidase, partial [Deltaproteobacteria bacterium]|nr:N-acetylmuramoyl-L-alanine amidase [Deltaproteobacteria bacterium]